MGYLPPGASSWTPGASWQPGHQWPAAPPARTTKKRGGIAGALIAVLAFLLKYGVFLLKFKAFFVTGLSMLIALFFYALIFGWQFGVGLVALIFIHEMGHYLVSRAEGLAVGAPVFLGPFGAFITPKQPFRDRLQEALVALAGPLFGFAATILIYLFAVSQPEVTKLVALAFALSYFGFFLTLFNLIPFSPLDGGRVAGVISKWANVVGLVIFVFVVFFMGGLHVPTNPFLFLILIAGVITTWKRFKMEKQGHFEPPVSPTARLWVAGAYIALVVVCAIGMSLAHSELINAGYIQLSE